MNQPQPIRTFAEAKTALAFLKKRYEDPDSIQKYMTSLPSSRKKLKELVDLFDCNYDTIQTLKKKLQDGTFDSRHDLTTAGLIQRMIVLTIQKIQEMNNFYSLAMQVVDFYACCKYTKLNERDIRKRDLAKKMARESECRLIANEYLPNLKAMLNEINSVIADFVVNS